jgi:flagellar motor switch protein FliN/FliY
MTNEILTAAEIDAAGEIFNIGMGSAANTISQVLDKPVSITKISASQGKLSDFRLSEYNSGLYASTNYSGGLNGDSCMIFKAKDIQAILNVLMMTDTEVGEGFEFDDMALSTIQEILNMMMQTCVVTMNEFLQNTSNLMLTAKSFHMDNLPVEMGVSADTNAMCLEFQMDISGVASAHLFYLISPTLSESMIKVLAAMGMVPEETAVAEVAPVAFSAEVSQPQEIPQPVQAPQEQAPPPVNSDIPPAPQPYPQQPYPQYQQPAYDPNMQYPYPQYDYSQYYAEKEPEIKVQKPEFPDFGKDVGNEIPFAYAKENMDNLMKVDLRVAAELGKVRQKMKDIMELKVGTVIDLNRSAGAPIEIIANKQPVGLGDIVVIGDNFYVRVTEIYNDLRQKKSKR